MNKALLFSMLAAVTLSSSACEKGLPHGDNNEVVVAAPSGWWPEMRDSVYSVLAPDVFTMRPERTFILGYQDPTQPEWRLGRMYREVVVIGTDSDPWIAPVLATLDDSVTVTVPGIVNAESVWSRDQKVTTILVDPSRDVPSQVFSLVEGVHQLLAQRFKEGVLIRMFVSGRDSTLADSLQRSAGFALLLPKVYQWGVEDSLYVFRNDNPDPAELIRQFGVTWRTPMPPEIPSADSLMDWKEQVSWDSYAYPQVVDRESLRSRSLASGQMRVTEYRGNWSNPPGEDEWPAAGLFILWAVECPSQDRLYLIDAWLYAPGKEKWEYMLQLETILGSFTCGPGGGG